MKNLAFLLVLLVFSSCKKETENAIPTSAKKQFKHIKKANWLVGDWDNLVNDAHFTEIWKQKNDSTLMGESYVTINKDTVFSETVDLIERNDSLFYVVSVKGENNEQPISFYMTKSANNEIVFENPEHDFPTKIVYKKITNDLMMATVSGMKDGKQIDDEYPFKRK